jgi:glycine cleavage system H protein
LFGNRAAGCEVRSGATKLSTARGVPRSRARRISFEQAMPSPTDRVYSESHEWHKVDGETLTLGLTRFAVDQLTDVTYVEMKRPGTKFKAGESIGEVESVKTTSDIYCAADGEVIEVNGSLAKDPSLVNSDPYASGWLVKVKMSGRGKLDQCVDAATYDKRHG